MILPIYSFGHPILRDQTEPVTADSDALQELIENMIETMHEAPGVGLAAPQVGRTERLFVADLSRQEPEDQDSVKDEEETEGPVVFINPEIVSFGDAYVEYEEGCLSIPDLYERIVRPEVIQVRFLDRTLEPQEWDVDGMWARVIQHELDHLDGVLFIDHLRPMRRRLLRRRLREMARGIVEAPYPLVLPDDAILKPA